MSCLIKVRFFGPTGTVKYNYELIESGVSSSTTSIAYICAIIENRCQHPGIPYYFHLREPDGSVLEYLKIP